jgi:hypothetical protein
VPTLTGAASGRKHTTKIRLRTPGTMTQQHLNHTGVTGVPPGSFGHEGQRCSLQRVASIDADQAMFSGNQSNIVYRGSNSIVYCVKPIHDTRYTTIHVHDMYAVVSWVVSESWCQVCMQSYCVWCLSHGARCIHDTRYSKIREIAKKDGGTTVRQVCA